MLNRLLLEHDHIRKKLNLLEMQFLELCRDGTPDLPMMRSIIVFIQKYPEQIHHPVEDMIYSVLLERKSDIKLLQDLLSDHTDLEALTRKLRKSLESYMNNDSSKEELKRQLSIFLIRQRQHLYIEEIDIYPLAKQLLTEADWQKIQSSEPYSGDFAFAEFSQDDYALLYSEIERHNK